MHLAYFAFVDLSGTSGENHFSCEVVSALARQAGVQLSIICPEPEGNFPIQLSPSISAYFVPKKRRGAASWHMRIQIPMWGALRKAIATSGHIDGCIVTLRPGTIVPPLLSQLYRVPQVLLLESNIAAEVKALYGFAGAAIAMNAIAYVNALLSARVFAAFGGVKEWIGRMPLISEEKVELFHHGVTGALFPELEPYAARQTLKLPVSRQDLVVGFVGSFKWYHRIDLLIRAIAYLAERNVRAVLVGNGPEFDAINDLSKQLGLADTVIFTGPVDHDRVGLYMAACDLLYGVIDPRHPGHPMKIYEYMASGRPVIAAATSPLSFIQETGAGKLISEITVESVAQTISELLQADAAVRRGMGLVGRRHVLQNYTWDALAERLVSGVAGQRRLVQARKCPGVGVEQKEPVGSAEPG